MTSLVSVRNVSKRLGDHQALTDVSFNIGNGEAAAVLGPSGSGKTTLLRLIAGLEVPDTGEIWLKDVQVSGPKRTLLAPHERGLGFVFQDLALWPNMTVAQSLRFVLRSAALHSGAIEHQRAIEETLLLVHINGLQHRYPHELSGGEQQRAALARALVHRPPLLLLDEPFSSLDSALREEMRAALRELRGRLGFAMVFVTHDRSDAHAVADRTIRLTRGMMQESVD